MKAQRNQHKEVAWVNVPGTSFQIGRDENGNVSMRLSGGPTIRRVLISQMNNAQKQNAQSWKSMVNA